MSHVTLDLEGMSSGEALPSDEPNSPSVDDEENQEDLTCVVCMDAKRQTRLPCGHSILCDNCAKRIRDSNLPCPNCRKPFTEYYKVKPCQLQEAPSFLSPDSGIDFGKLRRATLLETVARTMRRLAANGREATGVCYVLFVLFVLCLIYILPLALGVAEVAIGVLRRDEECDKPLSNWLVAIGAFHVMSFFNGCWRTARRQRGETEQSGRCCDHIITFSTSFLTAMAISWVYTMRSCDHVMFTYAFWYSTLCLVGISVGLLVFSICLVFSLSRRGAAARNNRASTSHPNNNNNNTPIASMPSMIPHPHRGSGVMNE